MIRYRCPDGVSITEVAGRPVFSNPQGGKIAVDAHMVALWQDAQQKSLEELTAGKTDAEDAAVRAALACLAEAGLLERVGFERPERRLLVLEGPLVSAIVVGYNSLEWLQESLPSLLAQTYRPLEIIVLDNGSVDGTAEWVREHYPAVRVLREETPVSFARANNLGIAAAAGEYFFLVNPDVRLEPDAVAQMVKAAQSHPGPVVVNARLRFWWAPAFLNGIGNRVGPFSWGTDNALGHLDLGQFDHWRELPSACFAAVMIPRPILAHVGQFDERFPMYYEDSEWCYRTRIMGYKVIPAHEAIVYHAFGGKVPGGESDSLTPRKLFNVAYGRYRFAFRIVEKNLLRFLRNYWMEDWANFTRLLVRRDFGSARAYLMAWAKAAKNFREFLRIRKELNQQRVLDDDALFAVQRDMPMTLVWRGLPELSWELVQSNYLPIFLSRRTRPMPEFDVANRRPHLLIVSNDVVDVKMAGPGMRYLEMARALNEDCRVTLAIPADTSLNIEGLRIVRYWEDRPDSLRVLAENSDAVLISGYMIQKFPFLAELSTRRIVDFYDPFVLENLHYYLNEPMASQRALNEQAIDITNMLAQVGDYFICGNERQRDYWMGILTANGRVNPENFKEDPSLRSLIDIVGIGIPDRPPQARPMLKGIHPNIPADARIVLWGGGIWNWLDPLTLIKAWPAVIRRYPQARLVFLGTRHPNPLVPRHQMAEKAEALASELGEKDRSIIFIEWVPYEDREALLAEADVSVTLHPIHVETRYSLRTRVLDSIWAGVPILITDGDITSEWVRQYRVGEVVPEFGVAEVAQALIRILDCPKEQWQANFKPLQDQLHWRQVVAPLRRYMETGKAAPDRGFIRLLNEKKTPQPPRNYFAKMIFLYRTEGFGVMLHRVWRHIQWRLNRI